MQKYAKEETQEEMDMIYSSRPSLRSPFYQQSPHYLSTDNSPARNAMNFEITKKNPQLQNNYNNSVEASVWIDYTKGHPLKVCEVSAILND